MTRLITITRTPTLVTAIIEHNALREVILDRSATDHGWIISQDDSLVGIKLIDDAAMLAMVRAVVAILEPKRPKEP